ncbi:hypothetical protein QAA18_03845 [Luteimonas sp. 8-5]|uniref:hypothetical protein n=1 Tax=Luteimonas sp. 8-5 TaxID=3039387 RepID=UPI002436586B|nr:hypothetical protein [Luteimonas sp. 8-5]MDG6347877.1 hypothetical protein [Luteimonas sp. 8-5]
MRALVLAFALLLSLPAAAAPPLRVMFVGNSLIYVNDLPRLVQAVAAAQPGGDGIEVSTWAAPGGSLDERWEDGHVARALAASHWDVLVLQERGGVLACMASAETRREAECRASERAHRRFAEVAAANGTRVLLLSTWGQADLRAKRRGSDGATSPLDEAAEELAMRMRKGGTDAQVVPAGTALRLWAAGLGDPREAFPDGTHPGLRASMIMAAQLYRALTGSDARAADLRLDFPLLQANAGVSPDTPMETQPRLAGDGSVVLLKAAVLAPYFEVANGSK